MHFVAGLGSGILSAVLLQPADLLKTRVQQSGASSLRRTLHEILNGPRALQTLWRGTLPSALRTGFGSALYFGGLNALRQHVARAHASGILGGSLNTLNVRSPGVPSSSSLPKLSNTANLVTGAVARASAGFLLMPMTIIKVRYESNLYTYGSIIGAGKDILRHEGLRGLFSGFGATALRDAPYAGLYLVFYEYSKLRLSGLAEGFAPSDLPTQHLSVSTSATINFTSGILGAGLATAITNPFDAIKTRIQLRPRDYRNAIQAGRKMVREDGFKSLLDGLGLRMSRKALSSALAWTVYEDLIRRTAVPWHEKKINDERAL